MTAPALAGGGPAFPIPSGNGAQGMTMLDWFAAQALNGIIATAAHPRVAPTTASDWAAAATSAYAAARAMMAVKATQT